MNDGRLVQGSRSHDLRNVSIIRGVIAGELPPEAGVVPGDARLLLEGREFAGSVIEVSENEIVFSTARMDEVTRLLGGPEPKPDELRPDDDEPVARIVERGREMGF